MSNVYVIQDPQGKNIIAAREFGNLKVILTGRESNSVVHSKLLRTFSILQPDDYILLIGKPLNIGIAVSAALKFSELMGFEPQFLVWDRDNYKYNIERITDGKRESVNKSTG